MKIKPFPIADWDLSQKLIINNDGPTALFSLWFYEFDANYLASDPLLVIYRPACLSWAAAEGRRQGR